MSTNPVGTIPEWTLGDRLRKARTITGLTTRDFATEIGVSQKTITDAETDKRVPRRITVMAYAMRTGVPLEWLETGESPHPDGPGEGLDEAPPTGLEPVTLWFPVSTSQGNVYEDIEELDAA